MAFTLPKDKVRGDMSSLIDELGISAASRTKVGDLSSEALMQELYGDVGSAGQYDVTTDPAYAGLKKAAYREADRTMRDVLAQGNARTGGFTNTAAVTAASQARDYTMAQYDDQIAALEDRALERESTKIALRMQLLSALEGMEQSKQQSYLSELEALETQNEADRKSAASEVSAILSLGQMPSDELMSRAGYSAEYISAIKQAAATPDVSGMSDAQLQQYLVQNGQSIAVDGVWGPKSEAAYKALFGTASGRTVAKSGTKDDDTKGKETDEQKKVTAIKNKDGTYTVGNMKYDDELRADLEVMYRNGEISYEDYSGRVRALAGKR